MYYKKKMPQSAYQIFKSEIFQDIKTKYFTDYKLKEGEKIISLVTAKCKEEWDALSDFQKEKYIIKSEASKIITGGGEHDNGDENDYDTSANNDLIIVNDNDTTSILPSYEQVAEEKTKTPKKQRKAIPKSVEQWEKI